MPQKRSISQNQPLIPPSHKSTVINLVGNGPVKKSTPRNLFGTSSNMSKPKKYEGKNIGNYELIGT